MTLPVSGGVPEQGLPNAAQRLESRAAAQGITVLEAELQDAVIAARRELNRLCGGGKFQMTIPVDLQRDSDVILGNLVALADKLVFESEKRGAALERPRPALPEPDWKDTARKVFDALCAAHHPTSCRKYADDSADCTCGRDAAFKAWEVTAELQNDYDLENE